MLYKLGFVWKWSDLEFRGENPRFLVKIAQEDEPGREAAWRAAPSAPPPAQGTVPITRILFGFGLGFS